MRFSALRRLATILSRFSCYSSFRVLARSRLFCNSFLFCLRRALFLYSFIRFLALRERQAPWLQRPRVIVVLRLDLVAASDFSLSFDIEIASSSLSTTSLLPLSRVLPPSAAPDVPFCRCRSDSAGLRASRCTTSTVTATAA